MPDETDKEILKILQEEGRISNLNLSQKIALSTASTHDRVKRLERTGVIEAYHAKLSPEQLGIHFQAYILIRLNSTKPDAINHFIHRVQRINEVSEAHKVSGNYNWILKIMCKSNQHFDEILTNKLGALEHIEDMLTLPLFSTTKDKYNVPID